MIVRVFRHFVPVSVILLALCELSIITIAWYFYLSVNTSASGRLTSIFELPTLSLSLIFCGTMAFTGLYHDKVFVDYRSLAIHIAISLVVLCPIALLCGVYWNNTLELDVPLWQIYGKAALSWLVCISVTRAVFLSLTDLNLFKSRVLVLGTGEKAARIAAIVNAGKNRYFQPVAYLRLAGQALKFRAAPVDICDNERTQIVRCAREFRANEVVVATDDRRGLPVHQLLQCRLAGIRVIDYLDFLERETMSVDLAAVQPGWFIFSDGFRGCGPSQIGKRCFDIFISLTLLMFVLPLMALTWLLIVFESPGPALYRQERVGLGGRPFVLLKFRSMRVDAETNGKAQWALTNDPRITRIGRIIRKVRIDELPQLINVLRGDMSIVGPRPERPAFVDRFAEQIPFYAERHCVRPGITGWAQINYPYGASLQDARNKLSYDLYYVKNHGLFLDLLIILQTFRVILFADGAR